MSPKPIVTDLRMQGVMNKNEWMDPHHGGGRNKLTPWTKVKDQLPLSAVDKVNEFRATLAKMWDPRERNLAD